MSTKIDQIKERYTDQRHQIPIPLQQDIEWLIATNERLINILNLYLNTATLPEELQALAKETLRLAER